MNLNVLNTVRSLLRKVGFLLLSMFTVLLIIAPIGDIQNEAIAEKKKIEKNKRAKTTYAAR
jgi:hypothetical protein